jgi:multiple sugar transport system substrate-binding protein
MLQTFKGEQDYDVVMVAGHLWLKDFVNKGYLAEVHTPDTAEYDQQDILDVIREEMKVGEKQYLYPSFCDGHILLYRKSIVEKIHGGPLPEVVDTDTIISIAAKCNGINGMSGIALKAHQSEIFLDFLPYLRNEGMDAFDTVSCQPTFNNEEGRIALEKYQSLKAYAPQDTYLYGNDEVRESFQNKKSVLAVTWGGQLGFVLTDSCRDLEDVGFATVKSAWNVTWSFAINRRSEKQELANTFLSYLTSKDIDRIVGGFAGAPVRKSTYEKDAGEHNWYHTHLELILQYAKPLPKMDNAGEKMAPLYEHVYEAFIGKQTVADALEEAEKKILKLTVGEADK